MFKSKWYFLGILFAALIITGCEKEKEEVNEAEVLVKYLESTNSPLMKDYVNTDLPSIISATDLNSANLTGQAHIIDIRSAVDFDKGHITNAVNVTLGDLLEHVESVNLSSYSKVAVVCYTGQTSGYAVALLRLIGHDNVSSLKWGMSSWHDSFAGPWKSATASGNLYATQFTSTVTEKGPKGDLPVLSTGFDNGQDILEARVEALLKEGYDPAKITNQAVFQNPESYYIVNYWPAAQYADPGHIPGAIQYTPKETLKLDVDLKTLPTDKPVVVYCYTGQTSSFIAAYLRLLGYDAKSLLFGGNGMIYDLMVAKNMTTFKDSEVMGYNFD